MIWKASGRVPNYMDCPLLDWLKLLCLCLAEYDFHWQNMIYTGLLSLLLAEYTANQKCSALLCRFNIPQFCHFCTARVHDHWPKTYHHPGIPYYIAVCSNSLHLAVLARRHLRKAALSSLVVLKTAFLTNYSHLSSLVVLKTAFLTNYSQNEDMKSSAKWRDYGTLGSLKVIGKVTIRLSV